MVIATNHKKYHTKTQRYSKLVAGRYSVTKGVYFLVDICFWLTDNGGESIILSETHERERGYEKESLEKNTGGCAGALLAGWNGVGLPGGHPSA
jgi:hypothetical protein